MVREVKQRTTETSHTRVTSSFIISRTRQNQLNNLVWFRRWWNTNGHGSCSVPCLGFPLHFRCHGLVPLACSDSGKVNDKGSHVSLTALWPMYLCQ